MTLPSSRKLERKISQARFALGWERLWSDLQGPVLVLMFFGAAVFSGLLPRLPDISRYGLLGLFTLALLWSLKSLVRLAWPTRQAAMRRIEHVSGLPHRPVTALNDRLASESAAPQSQALWEEHKLRQLRNLDRMRAGMPRSSWRHLDPWAFRVPAILALVLSLLLGPGDPQSSLADSLRLTPLAKSAPLALDAWLKPPPYTGKPPVLLTSPAMAERLKVEPEIVTPENTSLTVRLTGAEKPSITFYELGTGGEAGKEIPGFAATRKLQAGLFQAEAKLFRPAVVRVTDGNNEVASWPITLMPDTPPKVEITADPRGDASASLVVKWKTSDDYGVSGLTSDIALSDTQEDGQGIAGNGVFLFDAPQFPIALRRAAPKEETGSTTADLTAHPWAGLVVDMVIEARDAAGNESKSAVKTFKLPERLFVKPLAKVLIEQRRKLIMEPNETGDVEKMLGAVLVYPAGLIEDSGTHVAIAAALSQIGNARDHDDISAVIDFLWQIAIGVEEGDLADARAELEAIREELERALAEGASPERIAELMDKLRQAMDRYLQSMMAEAQKRLQQGGPQQDQRMQQGQMVTPQDLQKMLDMIEKLAESGARDAAQQLLSELENILRNLQPGMNQQQAGPQRDSPMGKMLDQLSELMRRQQQLMDDTQRMREPGEGDPQGENGQEPGNQGQQPDPNGLAGQQQQLSRMLEEFMRQLGRNGMQPAPSLGEAGKEMRGAEGSLRQQDREGALGQQGEALARLREGAQTMVREMLQQGQGQQDNQGRNGEARGDDRDPLGRPMPNRSEDFGPERDMLPSELAIRRAREILDMLRARAGEQGRPRLERDYIDRLLRGLY